MLYSSIVPECGFLSNSLLTLFHLHGLTILGKAYYLHRDNAPMGLTFPAHGSSEFYFNTPARHFLYFL
jgi:hypothetical protein